VQGAIDHDLLAACRRVVHCPRESARAVALRYTFLASHELFRSHLVPVQPQLSFADLPALSEPAAPAFEGVAAPGV
jgi:hypothetical protein